MLPGTTWAVVHMFRLLLHVVMSGFLIVCDACYTRGTRLGSLAPAFFFLPGTPSVRASYLANGMEVMFKH